MSAPSEVWVCWLFSLLWCIFNYATSVSIFLALGSKVVIFDKYSSDKINTNWRSVVRSRREITEINYVDENDVTNENLFPF